MDKTELPSTKQQEGEACCKVNTRYRVYLAQSQREMVWSAVPAEFGGRKVNFVADMQSSVQFCAVAQSCPTLCDPMNRSTPGLPVHHQLPEFTQTHVHRVGDAIQPSHPLSPLLLLPPVPPSIRGFSNESTLHIRWPKY